MTRGILVLDCETSSMDDAAEIVELGFSRLYQTTNGGWEVDHDNLGAALFSVSAPLSAEVRAIHHIEDRDLETKLPFSITGHEHLDIWRPDEIAACAAHNVEFDRRLIEKHAPMQSDWICTWKCANRLWPGLPSYKNGVLRYYLADRGMLHPYFEPERAMPPHRAGADAYVTGHILWAMLQTEPIETLIAFSDAPRSLDVVPVGKHKGKPWSAPDFDYLTWMLKGDFGADVIAAVRQEIDRRVRAKL